MKWVPTNIWIGKRIDDIEKSIGEIMNDLGEEEENSNNKREK
jgi:hypothetical protein